MNSWEFGEVGWVVIHGTLAIRSGRVVWIEGERFTLKTDDGRTVSGEGLEKLMRTKEEAIARQATLKPFPFEWLCA